jgi:prepilin-type N-terminal cleavage/methylation domain-containing protein
MHGTRYAARSKGGRAMMRDKKGFTLVELLVVIAIITILAATVVPRVANWIARARMARAVSEIKGADLCLTKMLTDTEKSNFAQFFDWNKDPQTHEPKDLATLIRISGAYSNYNVMFYELLRKGNEAFQTTPAAWSGSSFGLKLKDAVKRKMASSYMDIRNDPWDSQYQFFAGPWPRKDVRNPNPDPVYFRCWRGEGYVYDVNAKQAEDLNLPGNPDFDNQAGFPAARDLPVYIYSMGANQGNDQLQSPSAPAMQAGSGNAGYDDVNNWDSTSGWGEFY